jgi:hypothetical protein
MSATAPATSARIVRQALEFNRPDRLPAFDGFWPEFLERWRTEKDLPATAAIEDSYAIDLAVPVAAEQLFPSRVGVVGQDGEAVLRDDGWGRVIRTQPGTCFSETVTQVLREPADLDRIVFEPAALDSRYPALLEGVRRARQRGQAVFVKIGGVYIRSTFFRGQVEFLMDLAGDESFARALAERLADHLLGVGLESLRRAEAYDFGVWIYDDMCNRLGPMFSPATFERVFLPIYTRLIATLKAAGARWVFLHCDGNVRPLLDLLVEAGFDGINPVEYSAGMDVVELLERYRGRLRFVGGVCNCHILPSGDAARIQRHVEAIVDAGREGGLVIGTHSIGPDISPASYDLYRRIVSTRGA